MPKLTTLILELESAQSWQHHIFYLVVQLSSDTARELLSLIDALPKINKTIEGLTGNDDRQVLAVAFTDEETGTYTDTDYTAIADSTGYDGVGILPEDAPLPSAASIGVSNRCLMVTADGVNWRATSNADGDPLFSAPIPTWMLRQIAESGTIPEIYNVTGLIYDHEPAITR